MIRKKICQKIKEKTCKRESLKVIKSPEEADNELRRVAKYNPPKRISHDIKRAKDSKHDVSIIVPVYNCEKYISRCLRSVIDQNCSYTIQLIVIDDGSTDGSGKKIDEFQERQSYTLRWNIEVIHQKNAGVAEARNRGLEIADGRYLMFIDSDDYLYGNSILEKVIDIADSQHVDILQMNYMIQQENGIIDQGKEFKPGLYTEYKDMCECLGYCHMKLYRRHLFDNIEFPPGYLFEDSNIHLQVYAKCKRFFVIPDHGYVYTINKNGITKTRDGKIEGLDSIYAVKECILEEALPEGYMDEVLKTFGRLTYDRLKYLPEKIVKPAFAVMCGIIKSINQPPSQEYQFVYDAFINRDYGLWRWWCCKGEKKCINQNTT